MTTPLAIALFDTAHAVSEVVPPRSRRTVYLHMLSELGEIAEEAIIHTGELRKPAGPDGIMGEACDVINCLADLVWNLCHDDTEGLHAIVHDIADQMGFAGLHDAPHLPFEQALDAFCQQTGKMDGFQQMLQDPTNISHTEIVTHCTDLISALLVMSKAADPTLTDALFLARYEAKCAKWRTKSMPADAQDAPAADGGIDATEATTAHSTRLLGSVAARTAAGKTTMRLLLGAEHTDGHGHVHLDIDEVHRAPRALLVTLGAVPAGDSLSFDDPEHDAYLWDIPVDAGTATRLMAQYGYHTAPHFTACLPPQSVAFAATAAFSGPDTIVILDSRVPTLWENDLAEDALAVFPDFFVEQVAESIWLCATGLDIEEVTRRMIALGYVHDPALATR